MGGDCASLAMEPAGRGERAPGGTRITAKSTGRAGLSRDESHGTSPHVIERAGLQLADQMRIRLRDS